MTRQVLHVVPLPILVVCWPTLLFAAIVVAAVPVVAVGASLAGASRVVVFEVLPSLAAAALVFVLPVLTVAFVAPAAP